MATVIDTVPADTVEENDTIRYVTKGKEFTLDVKSVEDIEIDGK